MLAHVLIRDVFQYSNFNFNTPMYVMGRWNVTTGEWTVNSELDRTSPTNLDVVRLFPVNWIERFS